MSSECTTKDQDEDEKMKEGVSGSNGSGRGTAICTDIAKQIGGSFDLMNYDGNYVASVLRIPREYFLREIISSPAGEF
jgi:sensor histidine kinase regulating citrate/malate metabolism